MKSYTIYFAALNKLPDGVTPIAICGKRPEGWSGMSYPALAPKWSFFKVWKENHDNDYYKEHFDAEVLAGLDPHETWRELSGMACGRPFALVCYEKRGSFCHRHIVSAWLRAAGYDISEYVPEEDTKEG